LVEVAEISDDPAAERLLDAEFTLIPPARRRRLALAHERPARTDAGRKQEVLVVRRFERPSVRRAQDGAAPRYRIGDAEARLHERLGGQPVVVIEPDAELERGVAGPDFILDVRALLLARLLAVEHVRRAASRQLDG